MEEYELVSSDIRAASDPFFRLAITYGTVNNMDEYRRFLGKDRRRIIPRLTDNQQRDVNDIQDIRLAILSVSRLAQPLRYACPYYQRHALGDYVSAPAELCSRPFGRDLAVMYDNSFPFLLLPTPNFASIHT
jgi:hypothetical protein